MNQRNPILIIIITVALAGMAGYFTFKKSIPKTAEAKCNDLGGEWGQCFNSGPCCSINFSDAYKTCARGSDCQAKVCEIDYESKPDVDGNFTGQCPINYTGDPDSDFFKPHCGRAQIENGKITHDRRSEQCIIY